MTIQEDLTGFAKSNAMLDKGGLCVGLVVTRHARDKGMPLDPATLRTEGKGQVLGLGKSAVQKILGDHGITRILAEEGGRTSRGSMGNMERYVELLNAYRLRDDFDLSVIERFWIDRVRAYFAAKPLILRFDPAKSIRTVIRGLFAQASKRQSEGGGATHVGTVLQHLVAARISLLHPEVELHGASVNDRSSGRTGDVAVGDTVVHVTTAPGEALIRKCEENLGAGLTPLVVTIAERVAVVVELSRQKGIDERVDVFDIEQFLAAGFYERGAFDHNGRRDAVIELVSRYNAIVAEHETDPGLRIEISG